MMHQSFKPHSVMQFGPLLSVVPCTIVKLRLIKGIEPGMRARGRLIVHRLKYITAALIGVTALIFELIGVTFVKMSRWTYRFGDWATSDEHGNAEVK